MTVAPPALSVFGLFSGLSVFGRLCLWPLRLLTSRRCHPCLRYPTITWKCFLDMLSGHGTGVGVWELAFRDFAIFYFYFVYIITSFLWLVARVTWKYRWPLS